MKKIAFYILLYSAGLVTVITLCETFLFDSFILRVTLPALYGAIVPFVTGMASKLENFENNNSSNKSNKKEVTKIENNIQLEEKDKEYVLTKKVGLEKSDASKLKELYDTIPDDLILPKEDKYPSDLGKSLVKINKKKTN